MTLRATTEHAEELLPIYFGSDGSLFGCYHLPHSSVTRSEGVLLCYPLWQEYIRSHRTFALLARRLARQGFPVLRFDYYACGDSAGETEDASILRWIADTETAMDELRQRAGVELINLVGLRLGGALATLAATKRSDVNAIVLWDPVISGAAYVDELRGLQADLLRYEYVSVQDAKAAIKTEVLGFPITRSFQQELAAIDLAGLPALPGRRTLVIESGTPKEIGAFRDKFHPAHIHTTAPRIWLTEIFHELVPHEALETIMGWLKDGPHD